MLICGILGIAGWLAIAPCRGYAQDTLMIPPAPDTLSTDTVLSTLPSAAAKEPADTPVLPLQSISTATLDSLRKIHNPGRAAFYSAVLPGLGQAYNHQYIKIPLMYAGLGIATGVFMFNFDHYVTYRDAYRLRLNGKMTGDPRVDVYSPDNLKYLRDGYRQYVDYSVLGFAAAYLYNILDAIVFAHLYKFDVSNDLGLKFGPVIDQRVAYAGFGFTYTF